MSPSSRAPSVALAAPHTAAVEAARRVVEDGGNAVDAAVAAAAVLTVVYPHMCSVGGDLIALVREPGGTTTCVNSSGAYGSGAPVESLFADSPGMPVSGPLTVSVPGTPSGWAALLEGWGSIPLERVLRDAIALARDGMVVSAGLAEALVADEDALRSDPGMSSTFFPGDRRLTEGERVVQPALAETLEALARDGLHSFYDGRVADRLAAGFAQLGVPVTAADLARHRALLEPALSARLDGLTVSTAGPNSQGYTMLRTLGAVAAAPAAEVEVDAAVLAELLYSGDVLRDDELADPLVAPVDVERALSPEALAAAVRAAASSAITGVRAEARVTPRPGGDTIAVTAVSADGMAVSLIQSVFHSFGSLLLEPSTGLVLHNRAAFFTLAAGSPNRVEAGKRPAHTLVPVLVEWESGAIAAHGTMGGKAQSQIHAQLVQRVREGAGPLEAVSAPRFIVGGLDMGTSNDYIFIEPGLDAETLSGLERSPLRIVEAASLDSNAGHAMIARREPTGEVSAGADPRSDGGSMRAAAR
jgi:gamma-glutamyltranspeptidase/glutathione hydrolase